MWAGALGYEPTGRVRQTQALGPNLELKRTISSTAIIPPSGRSDQPAKFAGAAHAALPLQLRLASVDEGVTNCRLAVNLATPGER